MYVCIYITYTHTHFTCNINKTILGVLQFQFLTLFYKHITKNDLNYHGNLPSYSKLFKIESPKAILLAY